MASAEPPDDDKAELLIRSITTLLFMISPSQVVRPHLVEIAGSRRSDVLVAMDNLALLSVTEPRENASLSLALTEPELTAVIAMDVDPSNPPTAMPVSKEQVFAPVELPDLKKKSPWAEEIVE